MVAFAQVVSSVEVVAFLVGEQFLLSSVGDASFEERPRRTAIVEFGLSDNGRGSGWSAMCYD